MSWAKTAELARRCGRWLLTQTAFLFAFVVSVAANTTAGVISGSKVLLVAGLVIPTSYAIATEVWLRMPSAQAHSEGARRTAAALPVLVAALWSWTDITSLLLAEHHLVVPGPDAGLLVWASFCWTVFLCFVAPLSVDGLAVLAIYARRLPMTTVRGAGSSPAVGVDGPDVRDEGTEPWGGPHTVVDAAGGASRAVRRPAPRASVRLPLRRRRRTPVRVTPAVAGAPAPVASPAPVAAARTDRAARPLRAVAGGRAVGAPRVGDDLDGLGRDPLREIARRERVSVRGNAEDLATRIRTHRKAVQPARPAGDSARLDNSAS